MAYNVMIGPHTGYDGNLRPSPYSPVAAPPITGSVTFSGYQQPYIVVEPQQTQVTPANPYLAYPGTYQQAGCYQQPTLYQQQQPVGYQYGDYGQQNNVMAGYKGGKGKGKGKGKRGGRSKRCEAHDKMRAEDCLEADATGRLVCKAEHQCRAVAEGTTQLCSIHQKNRTLDVLVDDGMGGYRCSEDSQCKSKLGEGENMMEICAVHQKKRMARALEFIEGQGYRCSPGNECK
eukprot:GEMP01042201.1.p1 GENE.GEMP01042201.1~~GEMP01042201.1.p1  ORF type:complete len:232 (+),score=46.52 GEMP01042201.1:226-921(+)